MSKKDEMNTFFRTVAPSINPYTRIIDDKALLDHNDRNSMTNHSHDYDKLLDAYTIYIEKTLKAKRVMKIIFYIVSLSILTVSSILVLYCAFLSINNIQQEKFEYIDYIVPCVTSFLSFLTIFIVIPKIIAKYLFNSREESIMKDIVADIQDYDKQIRKGLNK